MASTCPYIVYIVHALGLTFTYFWIGQLRYSVHENKKIIKEGKTCGKRSDLNGYDYYLQMSSSLK